MSAIGGKADMTQTGRYVGNDPKQTLALETEPLAGPRQNLLARRRGGPVNPKGVTSLLYLTRFDRVPPYHLIGFLKPWQPGASAGAICGPVPRSLFPIPGSF